MQISQNPPVHLTYCLNVHPGETWAENFKAIRTLTLKVRDIAALERPFGLGMRLSQRAAMELSVPDVFNNFKDFLKYNGLYVFTINGFPFGQFHDAAVKEKVFAPDWRTSERRDYTILLAQILSNLLPENVHGSISTVAGSYKTWIKTEFDKEKMIKNLMITVASFAKLYEETGRELHLGLEPEPGCFIETTKEAVSFFNNDLMQNGIQYLAKITDSSEYRAEEMIFRHLGICFDTCHMSVQFENLTDSILLLKNNNINISKVQLSSALKTVCKQTTLNTLRNFCDPVYLHQVKARCQNGCFISYTDLPEALLKNTIQNESSQEWRIHFHVPLYYCGSKGLDSTSSELTRDFFKTAIQSGTRHFEIETYTYNILPESMKESDIVESISKEYDWILKRFQLNS